MKFSKLTNLINDFLAITIWPTRSLLRSGEIIYDLDYSPSTFGDFTYIIAYAASLSKSNRIDIVIKFSNKIFSNNKWKHLSKSEIEERILSIKNYGNLLLENINVKKGIKISIKEKKKNEIQFINYKIITKIVLLVFIFKRFSSFLGYKNFVFKNNKKNPKIINLDYISIIVRKDIKKNKSSWYDTEINFLDKLVKRIRTHNDIPIVIVSDKSGCDFAKKILSNQKKIYYSIDFGTIKESLLILLQSKLCIQKDGGGICVPYLLSEVPYFASMWPGNLHLFNILNFKSKNKYQKFYKKMEDNIFIKECILFLKNQ